MLTAKRRRAMEATSQNTEAALAQQAGRARGGKTRAARQTPAERSHIAAQGAQARRHGLKAEYEGDLVLREVKLPSAVLNDGTRVLRQREFLLGMGRNQDFHGSQDDNNIILVKLPVFLTAQNLEPFITKEMRQRAIPLEYRTKQGEKTWGYDATLLADVCDVYLDAQEAGVLRENQQHIAKRCLTLSRGFMRIGIIALVDEATGYQRARSIGELREKLAQLIMEEPTPTDKRRRDLLRLLFQDEKVFPND